MRTFIFFFGLLCFVQSSHAQQFPCNNKNLPIIFIHGFLGGGDNWTSLYQDFLANGYCHQQLEVFDWNSIGGDAQKNIQRLDSTIDAVMKRNNSSKVHLIAHSAGGGLSYQYCSDKERAKKVAKYVHIGSSKQKNTINRRIDMLNIYSSADLIARQAGDIDGAINIAFTHADHFQLVTDGNTARAVIHFIMDESIEPQQLKPIKTLQYHENLIISGKACTFGDNQALAKEKIEIYAINHLTGQRLKKKADTVFVSDVNGRWGPFKAKAFTSYEMVLKPSDTTMRTVYYFRDIFIAQNPLVYLRAIPKSGMTAFLLGGVPKDEQQAAVAIFSASRGVIAGRDSVTINGTSLSTNTFAPAKKNAIAFFLYDDGDKQSSGNGLPAFGATPFLSGVDMFINAKETKVKKKITPPASIALYYNTRKLVLPARKSKEGVLVAVFE